MNVSEQIIQVIDNLAQKFGIAIDWSAENIVPIIEELSAKYISYVISTSIMWMCVWLIPTIIVIVLYIIIMKNQYFDLEDNIGCTVVFTLIAALGIALTMTQVHDIIMCNTFPELAIINYVKGLIE